MEWLIKALEWLATATDAYFQTTLPQETLQLFVDTVVDWIALGMEYLAFFILLIGG